MKVFGKFLTTAALVAVSIIPAWSQVTKEQKDEVLARLSKLVTQNAFVPGADFSKWDEYLAKEREKIDKATNENDFVFAVNEALDKFGFSHIVMSTPAASDMRREGKMVGLGVRIEIVSEGILITDLIPGAPAEKAGIEVGDTIIEAEGKKPEGPQSFAGEAGTSIKVKVKKQDGSTKELNVVRQPFSIRTPESLKWVDKDVALLKIPSFDMGYDGKRVETLMQEAMKAKLLIVDLRSNGGGAVFNLVHLSNYLFPSGTALGTFINKSSVEQFVKEKKGDASNLAAIAENTVSKLKTSGDKNFKGQIATLINGGTGSASEILAAALKEIRGAEVIGSKSAGAVLASVIVPLPHRYQLQFPITDYVTIKGVRLEGNGVKADIEASMPRKSTDPDKGVEAAVTWYKTVAKKGS